MKRFYLIVLVVLQYACSPPTEIGADFFPEESFIVEEALLANLVVRTFPLDSTISTNNERLLVGRHQDPVFGLINGRAFSQFPIDDVLRLDAERNFRFDSLTLYLEYDGYSFYDTLVPVQLSVHQVQETMELDVDVTDLYTTDAFDFAATPIATVELAPRPRRGEPLEIRLDDAIGEDFFARLVEDEDVLLVESEFLDYFPGLVLQVTNADGAFVGFRKSTAQMRLYLTDINSLPLQQEIRTYTAEFGLSFNQILFDRTATNLEAIDEDEGLSSSLAEEQAFVQAGALVSRIDIPTLTQIRDDNEDLIVARAELRFRAVGVDIIDQEALPQNITVFWVEEDNTLFQQNTQAQLELDLEFGRDTYYTLDVTDFVQYQLEAENPEDNGLLLQFGTNGNAVDRLVLGDSNHPDVMELRLFTLDLKE